MMQSENRIKGKATTHINKNETQIEQMKRITEENNKGLKDLMRIHGDSTGNIHLYTGVHLQKTGTICTKICNMT